MDKYEYNLKIDQMKEMFAEENYDAAADVADSITWNKVKNVNALVRAGEVYEKVERYEEARELFLLAYDRSPIGRMIIYRLAEVSIKMRDFLAAGEYYREFVDIAPKDNMRYVLRYEIRKAEGAELFELIKILEEYKSQEYTEEWGYELAFLYHKAGNGDKCVEACDELILWFGDGPYVERALELKMLYQPLNKAQEEKYRRSRLAREGITTIDIDEVTHATVEIPQVTLSPERFNTVNLQEEIAKGMQQIMEATEQGTVSDTMDSIKKIVEEIPYLQIPKGEAEATDSGIPTDEEIDGSLRINFQELLGEDPDGQVSLVTTEKAQLESQITGQMTIAEILEEWEKTKRAAEAALGEAEQKRLDAAKARALAEAGDIMERLNDVIPKLDAGVTPRELLDEEYLNEEKMSVTADAVEAGIDLAAEATFAAAAQASAQVAALEANSALSALASAAAAEPSEMGQLVSEANVALDSEIARVSEETAAIEAQISHVSDGMMELSSFQETEEVVPEEEVAPVQVDVAEIPPVVEEVPIEDAASEEIPVEVLPVVEEVPVEDTPVVEEAPQEIAPEVVDEPQSTKVMLSQEELDRIRELEALRDAELARIKAREEAKAQAAAKEAAPTPKPAPEPVVEKAKPIVKLSDAQKAIFTYFAPIPGMEAQLCNVLNHVSARVAAGATAGTGNIIVAGGKGTGKTTLATSLVKALQQECASFSGRAGKMDAATLNKKDVASVLEKVQGGCLIIESAGDLTVETEEKLSLFLEKDTSGLIVILEDTTKGIRKALEQHSGFAQKFTEKVIVPNFKSDDLLVFAKAYAAELGYEIDEVAELALITRISGIEKLDQATTISEVKEIVDEAIAKEGKFGLKKYFSILTAKRYTENDCILLLEEHFVKD